MHVPAIGAAVAGAFRASEIENKYIGDVSDDVKADLNRRAGAVSQAAREASVMVSQKSATPAPKLRTGLSKPAWMPRQLPVTR
ncbi:MULTISPECIES: hypothetical protein [unclassified Bradyrhizobium]|uniref:hypothetical protein n=1 Tax=unclassified Bradyrhizobium TaxID=2631580 RepID=UPI001FFB381C|nr:MULTISPECIES: hypothetical protein [unclassified Bradyrhizobium]